MLFEYDTRRPFESELYPNRENLFSFFRTRNIENCSLGLQLFTVTSKMFHFKICYIFIIYALFSFIWIELIFERLDLFHSKICFFTSKSKMTYISVYVQLVPRVDNTAPVRTHHSFDLVSALFSNQIWRDNYCSQFFLTSFYSRSPLITASCLPFQECLSPNSSE